ncbi:MAG: type II toxin-antitoxin system PemK/MazF family toxin [Oscillospiraceae bacterium]|nr:type II toxin-antitoxin system PemK/MazF family toxin [Oscillospiraceae bacterium]
MARKNNRIKTEYQQGLGFDTRKYTTPAPITTHQVPDRTPLRGDIWFASLGMHPATSVQGGTRPVVIVSNDIGNLHAATVNVVPMTRHLKSRSCRVTHSLTPTASRTSVCRWIRQWFWQNSLPPSASMRCAAMSVTFLMLIPSAASSCRSITASGSRRMPTTERSWQVWRARTKHLRRSPAQRSRPKRSMSRSANTI